MDLVGLSDSMCFNDYTPPSVIGYSMSICSPVQDCYRQTLLVHKDTYIQTYRYHTDKAHGRNASQLNCFRQTASFLDLLNGLCEVRKIIREPACKI